LKESSLLPYKSNSITVPPKLFTDTELIFCFELGTIGIMKILLALFILLVPWPTHAGQLLSISIKDSRQVIWQRDVEPRESFQIVHRNSIYGALVWEAFQLDDQGSLWLKGLKTDHPAVLEYYGLEDVTTQWIPLKRKFEHLAIRVTLNGEFWVYIGKEKIPLSLLVADGSLVEVRGSELR
jgi:hypothetical protein